jgi:hypothetical protein
MGFFVEKWDFKSGTQENAILSRKMMIDQLGYILSDAPNRYSQERQHGYATTCLV